MRVGDLMTRSVVTTTPQTPVKDAAIVLADQGFTLLPVIEDDERLVGVLTEADVVRGPHPTRPLPRSLARQPGRTSATRDRR